jgi:hypothetical protein
VDAKLNQKSNGAEEMKTDKPRNLKGLIARALSMFQKYRVLQCCLETTGTTDECICITSMARVKRDMNLCGGHYLLSSKLSTAFDPMNVHGQTKNQNRYLHGNTTVYRQKLIEKHGQKKVDLLEFKSRQVKHIYDFTFDELDKNIAFWRKEIKRMETEKNL